jgi:hypothetical protein
VRKERIERIFCGLLQGRSAHDLTPEFLEGIAQVAVKAEAALSMVLTVEGLEGTEGEHWQEDQEWREEQQRRRQRQQQPPQQPPQLPAPEVQG